MNPYTLRFVDPLVERDYIGSHRTSARKSLFLINTLVMFLQLLGLFLILATKETSLPVLMIGVVVPISTLIITQFFLRKHLLFELGMLLQRLEVSIYLMELIFPRIVANDQHNTFLLGLVANCIYLSWGEGESWMSFGFQVVLSYTYYFIRMNPDVFSSSSCAASICLYLIVVGFLIGNYFHCEKQRRRGFYKLLKLSNEKKFWRNFIENTYQDPGFIIKLNNTNRARPTIFSIKSLLKSKIRQKVESTSVKVSPHNNNILNSNEPMGSNNRGETPPNSSPPQVKIFKRPEYSLGMSNTASRTKFSVFTKEDLCDLLRSTDFVGTAGKDEPILTFDEVLSQLTATNTTATRLDLKDKSHQNSFFQLAANTKQSFFRRARCYVGLIGGSHLTKSLEILVTIHVVEVEEELEKLKELDKAKDKILANVTHDLRSPLNGIMNFVEQAMEIEDMGERNKLLEYAKINSDLLLNLINDILDFSQYKEGKLRIGISSFGVIRLAEEVLKLLEFKAVSKGVKLLLSTNLKEEKYCESDPKRLKQVLINLIGNSLKFTSKGFIRLVINSTPYKNVLKFEVYDTGCGIRKDMIQKLFNPYVTFSESGNNNYGIGLGLNICQSIVQLLGPSEKLFISSVYGKGTKIGFLFFTNQEKPGSLPKNSINLSDKSVTISKDSAIHVTTGQGGRSPRHHTTNKGTPNFTKSTLNCNSKVESTIFSKFQRSIEKKTTENMDVDPLVTAENPQSKSVVGASDNFSPTLLLRRDRTSIHKKNRGITTMMEGWRVNRANTIKNTEIKTNDQTIIQIPSQNPTLLVQQSMANSSSILSRSMRINCSEYFTTFSLIEAESQQGFEVVHNGKSIEFLQEGARSNNDSANGELEELENGLQINKPTSFFQEEAMSFFSSESENHKHLLASTESLKRVADPFRKNDDSKHEKSNEKEKNTEKSKEKNTDKAKLFLDEKKLERLEKLDKELEKLEKKNEPSFGERSLALKVKLEKIDEDANEESKQELKTSHHNRKKSKKAFSFVERSPKPTSNRTQDILGLKHSLNIMVVDDDPFNTMIICRFLEKLDLPLKIERGSNGQEALDLFKQHNKKSDLLRPFHIIFLDCQMPIMNGYEAAKNIKECIKTGGYENTVVIAITAYNIQDEEEKCLLAGMDAVLMKPVSEWEFRELVNKFLVFEATHSML